VIKRSNLFDFLGVTIAVELGLDRHVSKACTTCFFWLQQPRCVRCSPDIESVKTLVHPLSHCASTIVTLLCFPCCKTSCSMLKMLQHVWSQGLGNTNMVCLVASVCDLPDVINCRFREFATALSGPVHFLSPEQQSGIHCLIICVI